MISHSFPIHTKQIYMLDTIIILPMRFFTAGKGLFTDLVKERCDWLASSTGHRQVKTPWNVNRSRQVASTTDTSNLRIEGFLFNSQGNAFQNIFRTHVYVHFFVPKCYVFAGLLNRLCDKCTILLTLSRWRRLKQ